MDSDFEGTIITERLAAQGKLDEFYDAVDSDNFTKVRALLKSVGVDENSVNIVIDKIMSGED